MEDKSKVVLFNIKEVVLLLILGASALVMAFALGMKLGKDVGLEEQGVTSQDHQVIQLKSKEEEQFESMKGQVKESTAPAQGNESALEEKEMAEGLEELHKELHHLGEKRSEGVEEGVESVAVSAPASSSVESIKDSAKEEVVVSSQSSPQETDGPSFLIEPGQYGGKYTIQMASYQSLEEANSFAKGLHVRGHHPVLMPVDLGEKGVWYRVGVGIFDQTEQAKQYIAEQNALFRNREFVVVPL